ncbi:MAG TPA: ABC transporter substrate-binding protein [Nocardioides sp.]
MSTTIRSRTTSLAAAVLLIGTLAACAGDDKDDKKDADSSIFSVGLVGDQPDGDPVKGGQLRISTFGELRDFDPAALIANGLSGGTELAAIYDVLLRHDPETGEYGGQLADSIEANDDATTYTLKLRDGVKFSDGTDLDADAVVASIERYLKNGGGQAGLWQRKVKAMKASDPLTVEFTMVEPWLDFEYMLASAPGMIVAASADAGPKFTPVGAGPYTFDSHAPGEQLVLKANPDYHGGAPALESLRFTLIQTAQGTLDVLKAGDADVAVLRDSHVIADAVESDLGGAMNVVSLGVGLVINHREGSVLADPDLRRAIAAALDPKVISERTYKGYGIPGTEMFPAESLWGPTDGPEIDLEEAKELVAKAKENGFDGKVRYLGIAKVSQQTGLSIEAMLGQIGIEVKSTYVPGSAEMIEKVFMKHDFDLAGWSFGTPDAAVFPELYDSFHSSSRSNAGGYADTEMDGLIEDLGSAQTEDEQTELIGKIQEQWNESIPAIVFGAQPEYVAWSDQVGGVTPHVDSIVLLDDAWLAK